MVFYIIEEDEHTPGFRKMINDIEKLLKKIFIEKGIKLAVKCDLKKERYIVFKYKNDINDMTNHTVLHTTNRFNNIYKYLENYEV